MNKSFIYIACFCFFVLGLCFGLVVQQAIIQKTVIEGLSVMEGVEINIDLNETEIVDRTHYNLEQQGFYDFINNSMEDLEK